MYNDFKFKKKFGQNFLKNNKIVENIVEKTNILDNSLVIEVGPGSGNLTRCLVKNAKYVLAYEIDETLQDILMKEFSDVDNIKILRRY